MGPVVNPGDRVSPDIVEHHPYHGRNREENEHQGPSNARVPRPNDEGITDYSGGPEKGIIDLVRFW